MLLGAGAEDVMQFMYTRWPGCQPGVEANRCPATGPNGRNFPEWPVAGEFLARSADGVPPRTSLVFYAPPKRACRSPLGTFGTKAHRQVNRTQTARLRSPAARTH